MATKQKRERDGSDTVFRSEAECVLPSNAKLSRGLTIVDNLIENIDRLGEVATFATDVLDVEIGLETPEVDLSSMCDTLDNDISLYEVAGEIVKAVAPTLTGHDAEDMQDKIEGIIQRRVMEVLKDNAEKKILAMLTEEANLRRCLNGSFALRIDLGSVLSQAHDALMEARDKAQEELRDLERATIKAHNEKVRRMTSKAAPAAPVTAPAPAPAKRGRPKKAAETPAPSPAATASPAPAAPVPPPAPAPAAPAVDPYEAILAAAKRRR